MPHDDPRARAVLALRQAAAVDPRFAPHVGLVLETRGVLGRGGMGTVHEVLDRRLGRVAALKLMHEVAAQDDPDARRFVREAEVTARLDHPSIPPVYEAGTDASGRQYLLMRRIEGEALSRRIEAAHAHGPPDRPGLRALVEVLVKVCDAVAYAHTQGVVHRDLKPANVMVGRFGEVLVLDWGLVRILGRPEESPSRIQGGPAAGDPQLTLAGGTLGTPGYMPPEQIEDASAVDARADVFALGAMLCHLLTGRGPIQGETALNKISATLQHRIARPRELAPGVPAALDAIAAAALAPDRERRTASALAVADDLRAWLADEPVSAYREGPGERLGRTVRRRPTLVVGVVAAALLLAGASAAAGLLARARSSADTAAERAASAERVAASAAVAESSVRAARDGLDLVLKSFGEAEEAALAAEGGATETAMLVSRALAAMPPTRMMLVQAARALDRVQRDDDARRLLERAVEETPTPGVLLWLHRLELQRRRANDYTTQTAPLKRLLDLARAAADETDAWLWLARAFEDREAGRLEEAERHLEEALRRSDTTTTRALRAELRRRRGDLAGAIEDLEEGVRLTNDSGIMWRLLLLAAATHMDLGDYEGAAKCAQRAVGQGATSADARFILATARNRLGEPAAALAALEKQAGRRGVTAAELAELAWTRWQLGDAPGAVADAARALALEPTSPLALRVRGEHRLLERDFAGAFADLRAGLQQGDPGALEAAGVAAVLVGQLLLAEESLTTAIGEARRPLPRAHTFRGLARYQRGDVKGALEDLDRAVALGSPGPFGPLAWRVRGQARARSGDLVGAVADLRRFLELEPPGARPESVDEAQAALDEVVVRLRRS